MKTFLALALVSLLLTGCADSPATTSTGGNNVGPTQVTSAPVGTPLGGGSTLGGAVPGRTGVR